MARAGEEAAATSLHLPPLALSCTGQGKMRLLLYEPPLPARTMCTANSPGPPTESAAQLRLSGPPQKSHGKKTKLDMMRADNRVSKSQVRKRSPWAGKKSN